MSNTSTRKTSLDNEASRSVGRSSNGGRTGSNDRPIKLKITNKSKKTDKNILAANIGPDGKNQKIIAQIQRMRTEGR